MEDVRFSRPPARRNRGFQPNGDVINVAHASERDGVPRFTHGRKGYNSASASARCTGAAKCRQGTRPNSPSGQGLGWAGGAEWTTACIRLRSEGGTQRILFHPHHNTVRYCPMWLYGTGPSGCHHLIPNAPTLERACARRSHPPRALALHSQSGEFDTTTCPRNSSQLRAWVLETQAGIGKCVARTGGAHLRAQDSRRWPTSDSVGPTTRRE